MVITMIFHMAISDGNFDNSEMILYDDDVWWNSLMIMSDLQSYDFV